VYTIRRDDLDATLTSVGKYVTSSRKLATEESNKAERKDRKLTFLFGE